LLEAGIKWRSMLLGCRPLKDGRASLRCRHAEVLFGVDFPTIL
jgi:hypothetical protein